VRRFFSTNFDINAFCISGNLIGGLIPYVTTGRVGTGERCPEVPAT
jgi:hypothetical protein